MGKVNNQIIQINENVDNPIKIFRTFSTIKLLIPSLHSNQLLLPFTIGIHLLPFGNSLFISKLKQLNLFFKNGLNVAFSNNLQEL